MKIQGKAINFEFGGFELDQEAQESLKSHFENYTEGSYSEEFEFENGYLYVDLEIKSESNGENDPCYDSGSSSFIFTEIEYFVNEDEKYECQTDMDFNNEW